MKTLITAHSGCDGTPDNSLEFISHALRSGADALEVDVRAAQDGTLYLSHDRTDAACPKLSQAFPMLRSRPMRINCDLKQPGLEEAVLALAAAPIPICETAKALSRSAREEERTVPQVTISM